MRLTTATFGPLAPYLIDLAAAFEARGVPLMLVGGFGLVLRRQWRQEQGERTLIEAVPPARATEDFDVLLTLEVLGNAERTQAIREALSQLGYQPIEGREFYQFNHPESATSFKKPVKVDFLASPPAQGQSGIAVDFPRVKRKPSPKENKIHARVTEEASITESDNLKIQIEGIGNDGHEKTATVDLPHPFLALLMKLRAFQDEFEEGRKPGKEPRIDYANKHLRDIYTLVALLTLQEADELPETAKVNSANAVVQDAIQIVSTNLADIDSPGMLLLRSRLRATPEDLTTFLEMLHDTFN